MTCWDDQLGWPGPWGRRSQLCGCSCGWRSCNLAFQLWVEQWWPSQRSICFVCFSGNWCRLYNIYIYTFLCVCICVYIYICVYICIYIYMYIYCTYIIILYTYVCIYILYIYNYIYVYICLYIYMYMCIYICICVYMYHGTLLSLAAFWCFHERLILLTCCSYSYWLMFAFITSNCYR